MKIVLRLENEKIFESISDKLTYETKKSRLGQGKMVLPKVDLRSPTA